jgi:hypothetical protein
MKIHIFVFALLFFSLSVVNQVDSIEVLQKNYNVLVDNPNTRIVGPDPTVVKILTEFFNATGGKPHKYSNVND